MHHCIRLTEHADGYALRLMWVFGGGVIWVSHEAIVQASIKDRKMPVGRAMLVTDDGLDLKLEGRMRRFVERSLSRPA
ncbi:MAG: hypothetical protein AAGI68_06820 [Planctomycetota bacterium]